MVQPTDKSMQVRGAISVAFGAAVWGLFWIPLRYLDSLSVHGLWAVAYVLLAAAIPSLVITVWRRELSDLRSCGAWLIGFGLGISTVLYFTGILFSDVIRVIFLFYLLPLWTTLSARVIYGEKITKIQLLMIVMALLGVWLLLGGATSFPQLNNIGDWCGIAAGMCWGISLTLLRGRDTVRPFANATSTLVVGGLLAALLSSFFAFVVVLPGTQAPQADKLINAAPVALAFGMFVLFPSLITQIWGARLIAAPTAALLTMTEILVATVSAYWLIGTELSSLSVLGAGIILLTVIVDLRLKFTQLNAASTS